MENTDAWMMTERLHAEQGRGDPFAAAMRATRMPMIITDPRQADNPIVFANGAFLLLTGYGREEVIGRNCRFLQGPDTDPAAIAALRAAIAEPTDISVDLLNYRRDGSAFWNALYLSPVRNEAGELVFFFASQLDVTERIELHDRVSQERDRVEAEVARRTLDLREALDAKTMLLHEVDHRVKNNLQMISSLVALQMRTIADPSAKLSLRQMQGRIDALGAVHRRLYQSDDVTRFDLAEFIRDLVANLVADSGRSDVAVALDLHPVELPADRVAPLALMVNELLTNVIKHAFPERPGRIEVESRRQDGQLRIVIADDGVGMPDAIRPSETFGRRLVETLGRQLRAGIAWQAAHPGTRVQIDLPIEALALATQAQEPRPRERRRRAE